MVLLLYHYTPLDLNIFNKIYRKSGTFFLTHPTHRYTHANYMFGIARIPEGGTNKPELSIS